jgi:hypothetical protein
VTARLASHKLIGRFGSLMLFAQVLALLCLAQIVTTVFPFRRYIKWLAPSAKAEDAPPELVRSLRRKISIASRVWPGGSKCLVQAVAARILLNRRGYRSTLFFGVSDPQADFSAHAWLSSGGIDVCGGPGSAGFTEVARF